MEQKSPSTKKLLENPFIGNLVVPIAIVLVAGLLIFGVSTILSTDRSYKDLVREMRSKTFGNRWVAAYELSKLIATSQIPSQDTPWLVENLVDLHNSTQDKRTRKFIVMALGSLKSQEAVNFLTEVLDASNPELQFHIIASMGNHAESNLSIPEEKLLTILNTTEDKTIQQAAVLTLATHRVEGARRPLIGLLNGDHQKIRISAALGLINFKEEQALPHLREILQANTTKWGEDWTGVQIEALKINLLDALERNKWAVLFDEIEVLSKDTGQLKLAAKSRNTLNVLKNNGFRNKN